MTPIFEKIIHLMKVADIKSAELFIKTNLVEYEKEFNDIYTNCINALLID